MLARLLLNPWGLALTASAVAALMAWAAWGQLQRAQASQSALRGYEEASRVMTRQLEEERRRTNNLILSLEELANVEDSNVCVDSGSIRVLPDLLRRQRANP